MTHIPTRSPRQVQRSTASMRRATDPARRRKATIRIINQILSRETALLIAPWYCDTKDRINVYMNIMFEMK
jgi:hypothetical protein